MTVTTHPHGLVTRWIHWVSAALIGFGYLKGADDVSFLAHPSSLQFEVIFAIGLGLLFCCRFVWTTYFAGPTRLPAEAPKWERTASRAVHLGLYASAFAIILSGLAIALVYSTPALGPAMLGSAIALHEASLAALPILLAAHIAGALWHRWVRRDGVLESMIGK